MSAVPVDSTEQQHQLDVEPETEGAGRRGGSDETAVAGTPVVVRRNAGVAALVGYAASAVAIAYLWRASQTMTVLDWALFGVMTVIAGIYLAALVDARTPLLVADDLGVRIRLGNEWRGLPWEAIGHVVVHPRRGLLRDGRLVFAPRNLARAVEGLDVKARRHIALNQKMYGAPLAVPLGSTTRVDGSAGSGSGGLPGSGVADDIAALAYGRAEVVVLDPETLEVVEDPAERDPGRQDGQSGRETDPILQGRAEDATDQDRRPRRRSFLRQVQREEAHEVAEVADGQADAADPVATADEAPASTQQVVFPANGVEITWHRAGQLPRPSDEDDPTASMPDAPGQQGNPVERRPLRSVLGGIGTIVSRVGKGRRRDLDIERREPEAAREQEPSGKLVQAETSTGRDPETRPGAAVQPTKSDAAGTRTTSASSADEADRPADEPTSAPEPAKPPFASAALRPTRPGLRAEAKLDLPPTAGNAALDPSASHEGGRTGLPEGRELRRPGNVDLVFEKVDLEDCVRPISALGDPVEPLVIDDYVTEPAYDPVIGPELAAARTRLGLSVDDLAERTRIRPHVIESIEVDDFAPCGGDFYARGHLRTLARILGLNVEPLLEKFEERYATAPINARRVFEAELATGMTGSMRSTMGGPSWGLLVGAVLVLVLVWGVLRLFTTEPSNVEPPVVHGSAVVVTPYAAPSSSGQ